MEMWVVGEKVFHCDLKVMHLSFEISSYLLSIEKTGTIPLKLDIMDLLVSQEGLLFM